MSADSDDMNFDQQSLALASEALRVARMSNCTLFAIPDPDSEWGFVPESFLGSADWMFSVDGIRASGICRQVFDLAEKMWSSEPLDGLSLKAFSEQYMATRMERVVLYELVEQIYEKIPEIVFIVRTEVKALGYEDFNSCL